MAEYGEADEHVQGVDEEVEDSIDKQVENTTNDKEPLRSDAEQSYLLHAPPISLTTHP